ncbi:imidazole glycerol phosphate synthase subunit HisH [Rummeliibacillus pycnus]|uniref:imidazole glycerol phosphate synthase subunit HisH n=1 Tax=Rummeliibacillus pycnus TaxID=101070 RepID=UPI000C9D1C9C|nr:imidazole glycerol phosphate synthase subunit HisH [Rummeliibacillus pycnus]
MKIGVIDYGMGNLFSVEQAIKRLGNEVVISADQNRLLQCDALILPGVGAFQDAMKKLQDTGLVSLFQEVIATKKPLLGICLGMQLLFQESEENGVWQGLGIFKGRIKQFSGKDLSGKSYRVPHMGWNNLQFTKSPTWLDQLPKERYVYFVHSYFATDMDEEDLVAFAEYGDMNVPGIVQKGTVTGMQFHPEKSGECGVYLLQQWLRAVSKGVVVS